MTPYRPGISKSTIFKIPRISTPKTNSEALKLNLKSFKGGFQVGFRNGVGSFVICEASRCQGPKPLDMVWEACNGKGEARLTEHLFLGLYEVCSFICQRERTYQKSQRLSTSFAGRSMCRSQAPSQIFKALGVYWGF